MRKNKATKAVKKINKNTKPSELDRLRQIFAAGKAGGLKATIDISDSKDDVGVISVPIQADGVDGVATLYFGKGGRVSSLSGSFNIKRNGVLSNFFDGAIETGLTALESGAKELLFAQLALKNPQSAGEAAGQSVGKTLGKAVKGKR